MEDLIRSLKLPPKFMKEYTYVEDVDFLILGRYIRWVYTDNLKKIYNGGFLISVDPKTNVLLCKNRMALFTVSFEDALVYQKMSIDAICFPLFKEPIIHLGWLVIPFFALVIIGCSNAVNLTDGLDGLATGCSITTALAYAILAYLAGHFFIATDYLKIPHNQYIGELTVFLMALVGAGFGFLWFNCHPAKVFMGDTGSLAIGGALGSVAIATKQELLLVIIGGVFVMEALSVILQVGSFKLRKKRIFRMSPIHHHFELGGWHESQVIIRFWLLSMIFALIGLALLKIR